MNQFTAGLTLAGARRVALSRGAVLATLAAAAIAFLGASCTSRGPETRKAALPAAEAQSSKAGMEAEKVLLAGKKLENVGEFQKACDMYSLFWRDRALHSTGQATDIQLADQIKARDKALRYLVQQLQVRPGESVFWKPKNNADLAQGHAQLYVAYDSYRSMSQSLLRMGTDAAKFGQSTNDRAAYEARVGRVMDAYVNTVNQANEYQLATYTFEHLSKGILYLTGANRDWTQTFNHNYFLKKTLMYFDAANERFDMTTLNPGADSFWPR